jgi:signal transduction histidine kinase
LQSRYAYALQNYVRTDGEAELAGAHELGRRAIREGLELEAVVLLHQETLQRLNRVPQAPGQTLAVRRACDFFLEVLAPFERSLFHPSSVEAPDVSDQSESARLEAEFRLQWLLDLLLARVTDGLDSVALERLEYLLSSSIDKTRLLAELLELARVERAPVDCTRVNLTALSSYILTRHQEREPGRKVQTFIQEQMTAEGDARLLARVLEQLLDNAWKFSSGRSPARVEVTCRVKGGVPIYRVKDNGLGFAATDAHRLFNVLHVLDPADPRSGCGVGLALVHEIVARHQGRVWLESTSGLGTEVEFVLGHP